MRTLITAAFFCVLLAGCGANAGKEFLGKWQHVKFEKRSLQIDRNGDNFIVRETSPSILNGKMQTQNLPATLRDGSLRVSGQIGTINLVIDDSNGHLTGPGVEYKKAD